jgi:hypothetical protein
MEELDEVAAPVKKSPASKTKKSQKK